MINEDDVYIEKLEQIIKDHIDLMENFNGSSLPESWDFKDEVKEARKVLKERRNDKNF